MNALPAHLRAAIACFAAMAVYGSEFPPVQKSPPPSTAQGRISPTRPRAGERIISVDPSVQQRIQLKVAPLSPASIAPRTRAFGRVLDPAPLAEIAAQLASAQVAATNSTQESRRIENLAAQNNASARMVETAAANAQRDALAVEAIQTRLRLSWSNLVAARATNADFIRSLISRQTFLVEVKLPAGQDFPASLKQAELLSLDDGAHPIPAELLSRIPRIDPNTQARGALFLVRSNAVPLIPGMAVTALLPGSGVAEPGVLLPGSAVVHAEGEPWAYLQIAPAQFVRRRVFLDQPIAHGWFVTRPFKPGDPIVTVGAQALLSQESKFEAGKE